jgi:protein TonB
MIESSSLKLSPMPQWQANHRLLLLGGILIGHFCLLGLLLLLPKDEPTSPEPLPMVMVELQTPPIPLHAGNASTISQEAVTATNPPAALTHAAPAPNPPLSSNQPKPKAVADTPKPTVTPMSNLPAPAATSPTKIAPTVSSVTSETGISSSQSGSPAASSSNNSAAKTGTSIASVAPASRGDSSSSSSPQYGAGYLSNPAPDYPDLARSMGEEGKVLLHVLVTAGGLAKKVKLHRSSGSDSLDDAALRAVRKWRFVPAKLGEQAIEAWVYVPIVFKLD